LRAFAGKSTLVLTAALLLAGTPPALALDERWSVSFSLGGHLPSLGHLDDGLYRSSFLGTATVLVREGSTGGLVDGEDANETEVIPFRYDNMLGSVRVGPLGSVEFAWHANERHAFIFGFGSMESVTTSSSIGNLPVQQYFVSNVVASDRRGKISFTDYTLGWRYTMLRRNNFRMYSRLTIHEVFDIDYREEWTFLFTESPIDDLIGVRRNMVAEASSASLFMGQIGIGGEWFLNDWFSIGLEGGYLHGEREFSLREVELRDDFAAGDAINRLGLPYRQMPDGTLGFLSSGASVEDLEDPATRDSFYTPIRLGFDGWRVGLRVNLYF
jgi:hypothetical protein